MRSTVFTPDELTALYPTATSAYFMNPRTGAVSVDLASLSECPADSSPVTEMLFKMPTNKEERDEENKFNDLVRYMFSRAPALTSLHPEYSTLVVEYTEATPTVVARRTDRILVYRRFMTDMGTWNQCDTGTMSRMAAAVLRFLSVMHSHAYVHMDVKPDNVLCDLRDGAISDVVLADYGLVYPMDDVFAAIAPRSAGGADDEFDEGTCGFKSPLLRKNGEDSENRLFPIFTAVARGHPRLASRISRAEERGRKNKKDGLNALWMSYFSSRRNSIIRTPQDVAKVDLQSLGISMVRMLPGNECALLPSTAVDGTFRELVGRLLLCEKDSFYDATSALRYMEQKRRKPGSV